MISFSFALPTSNFPNCEGLYGVATVMARRMPSWRKLAVISLLRHPSFESSLFGPRRDAAIAASNRLNDLGQILRRATIRTRSDSLCCPGAPPDLRPSRPSNLALAGLKPSRISLGTSLDGAGVGPYYLHCPFWSSKSRSQV